MKNFPSRIISHFSLSNPKTTLFLEVLKRTYKLSVHMFDEKDLEQFKKKGTTAQKVEAQLELIKNGFLP